MVRSVKLLVAAGGEIKLIARHFSNEESAPAERGKEKKKNKRKKERKRRREGNKGERKEYRL